MNQIRFWIFQKIHVKKSRNSKLKEKYYINENKLILLQKKKLYHSLKFNKQGGPNKLWVVGKKSKN